jgi:hypothetical protein
VICPYCRERLDDAAALACETCATPVHAECAALHGRCVVFACAGMSFGARSPTSERTRLVPELSLRFRFARFVLAPLEDALALELAGVAGIVALLLAL